MSPPRAAAIASASPTSTTASIRNSLRFASNAPRYRTSTKCQSRRRLVRHSTALVFVVRFNLHSPALGRSRWRYGTAPKPDFISPLAEFGTERYVLARCRRDWFFKHLFFCFVLFACVIADAVTDLTTDLSVLDLQLLNIVTEQRLFHSKLKAHRQSMLLPACDDPPHSLLFLRSCRSYT